MQSKKSKQADLESKRSIFFLIGLSVAILASVVVIQLESSIKPPEIKEQKKQVADAVFIPQTKLPKPEPPANQETSKPKPVDPNEIFKIVDSIPDSRPTLTVQKPMNSNQPLEWVGMDDEPDIPTMPIVAVQEVAVPMSCVDAVGKEARMDCLNKWIQQFINANARYPEQSRDWGEEDKVYVSFVIDEHGDVRDVELLRGDYEKLNAEALRVVGDMPRFAPAKHQGRKVKMQMRIPVNFKLK
jgi:protein TonB